ncbi:hypothetical protein [Streptomyces sp. G-G2]|uniref:hypothetical protein n=1 Tax=Streptomyces sp. G-G2 TaxID=3046201 RepID=UPI0024B89AA2|nr:hypothetical protein [Streptomyces sp. G-G2]MDJ0379586.1 hypothetical protein [Streptomyces sp. G-G2]
MGAKGFTAHARRLRWLSVKGLAVMALAAGTLTFAPAAQADDYGPYTCKTGLVWREAVPGDYVCVSPPWRTQTQHENAAASSNAQPGGGAYGPDTCKPGYVWRETRPSDHVCVLHSGNSRFWNKRSDETAYTGYVRYPEMPANGTSSYWENIDRRLHVRGPGSTFAFYGLEPGRDFRYVGSTAYGQDSVSAYQCGQSSSRRMQVVAVDALTGSVSNAGSVAVPSCM